MADVSIVMGSDSDLETMGKAADLLDTFGITYEMTILSAHREPDLFFRYASSAEERGVKVIIAGAGMAAHLPGMCAALFPLPVIGVPLYDSSTEGWMRCIRSYRCRQAFLWQRWRSAEPGTPQFWQPACWRFPMKRCADG